MGFTGLIVGLTGNALDDDVENFLAAGSYMFFYVLLSYVIFQSVIQPLSIFASLSFSLFLLDLLHFFSSPYFCSLLQFLFLLFLFLLLLLFVFLIFTYFSSLLLHIFYFYEIAGADCVIFKPFREVHLTALLSFLAKYGCESNPKIKRAMKTTS